MISHLRIKVNGESYQVMANGLREPNKWAIDEIESMITSNPGRRTMRMKWQGIKVLIRKI